MKLSKTSWSLLTIGIFMILFTSLGVAYAQQGQEQSRLNPELSLAQLLLTKQLAKFPPEKFSSQQRELESRLAKAESQLETAKTTLSQLIESIEVTDTLFEAGDTCRVEIIEISSAGLTNKELGDITCSVLSLVVKVEGDVPNLTNFVVELSRRFPTGVAQSVQINVPEVIEEEEETGGELETESGEEELEKPSANIQLVIYFYQGD